MPNAYLRFINILKALDRLNPGQSLDHLETRLLKHTLREAENGNVLLVGDLIGLAQYGSQATLHGKVKNLVDSGFINLVTHQDDARKKIVVPTKRSLKYIQFMSDCMKKSMKPIA